MSDLSLAQPDSKKLPWPTASGCSARSTSSSPTATVPSTSRGPGRWRAYQHEVMSARLDHLTGVRAPIEVEDHPRPSFLVRGVRHVQPARPVQVFPQVFNRNERPSLGPYCGTLLAHLHVGLREAGEVERHPHRHIVHALRRERDGCSRACPSYRDGARHGRLTAPAPRVSSPETNSSSSSVDETRKVTRIRFPTRRAWTADTLGDRILDPLEAERDRSFARVQGVGRAVAQRCAPDRGDCAPRSPLRRGSGCAGPRGSSAPPRRSGTGPTRSWLTHMAGRAAGDRQLQPVLATVRDAGAP